MASFADLFNAGTTNPTTNLGSSLASQFSDLTARPYTTNYQPQNLQEDAAVQDYRLRRNFSMMDLPNLINQGAAKGQWGSSGLATRANQLGMQVGDQTSDIQRNLYRSMADLTRQRVLSTFGSMI